MPQLNFDMTNVEVESFDPVPAGDYQIMVEDSELRQSKNGFEMIYIKFRVVGPTHANRVISAFYNVGHEKEDVRRIAFSELKALANACGFENITATEQVHGRTFTARVEVEGEFNRLKDLRRDAGAPPQPQAPAPQPQYGAPQPAPQPQPASAPLQQPGPAPAPWQQNQG